MKPKRAKISNNVLASFRFPFWSGLWTFELVLDLRGCEGNVDDAGRLMRVRRHKDPEETRDTILHELLETSYKAVGGLYTCEFPTDTWVYLFDHTKHHLIAAEVRAAYDFICGALEARGYNGKTDK